MSLPIFALSLLTLAIHPFRAADTLPSQLTDAAYWKMIADFSEPDTPSFFDEWLTGNESGYQHPLPQVTKSVAPGGVYLGVGPEQNFTYIAAVRPKIAFIIGIRREILLEHLMYKAIFEISSDRAEFVGKLGGCSAATPRTGLPRFPSLSEPARSAKGIEGSGGRTARFTQLLAIQQLV